MAPLKETDKNKNGAQLFAINRYERKVKFVWKKKTTKTKKIITRSSGKRKIVKVNLRSKKRSLNFKNRESEMKMKMV